MRYLVLIGLVAALATPATVHAHGAKSKRHAGKYHRTDRARQRRRAHRRRQRYDGYYDDGSCPVQPLPHFQDHPYWAACAFTPKNFD